MFDPFLYVICLIEVATLAKTDQAIFTKLAPYLCCLILNMFLAAKGHSSDVKLKQAVYIGMLAGWFILYVS